MRTLMQCIMVHRVKPTSQRQTHARPSHHALKHEGVLIFVQEIA